MPSFQRILWQVVWSGCVTSIQDPTHAYLANPFHNQAGFVFPHAGYGDSANIEVHVFHARIVAFDCLDEDIQRLVGCWIVIAATSGKMCDLYRNVWRLWEKLLQKNSSFFRSIRSVMVDVGVHMHRDCHAISVCSAEYTTHAGEVVWIINVHIGVTEV